MDKKLLNDYIDACAVIKETEAEIRKLEKKKKLVQDKVSGSNPEWPYEPRTFSVGGTVETVGDANQLSFEKNILETRREEAEGTSGRMDEGPSLPDAEDHQVQIFPQIILGRGCGVDEIETGRGSNKVRVLQIHEKKMKVCTVLYGLYGFKML